MPISDEEALRRARLAEVARARPRPDREEVLRRRAERKRLKRARKSGVGEGGRRNVHKKGKDCVRFRMRLAYDGRSYHGWQKQRVPGRKRKRAASGVGRGDCGALGIASISEGNATAEAGMPIFLPTIEGTLEACLRPVLNRCFIASGRTGARVSARAQMVQFDANLTGLYEHVSSFKWGR